MLLADLPEVIAALVDRRDGEQVINLHRLQRQVCPVVPLPLERFLKSDFFVDVCDEEGLHLVEDGLVPDVAHAREDPVQTGQVVHADFLHRLRHRSQVLFIDDGEESLVVDKVGRFVSLVHRGRRMVEGI